MLKRSTTRSAARLTPSHLPLDRSVECILIRQMHWLLFLWSYCTGAKRSTMKQLHSCSMVSVVCTSSTFLAQGSLRQAILHCRCSRTQPKKSLEIVSTPFLSCLVQQIYITPNSICIGSGYKNHREIPTHLHTCSSLRKLPCASFPPFFQVSKFEGGYCELNATHMW